MKTALVNSTLVIEGKTYQPGATVTLDEEVLAPFVALSLASWMPETGQQPADGTGKTEVPAADPPKSDDQAEAK